jgi:uncharacterized damage-inducible protein DinB
MVRIMSRSILSDAFDHHVWATVHLLDACAELTVDQLATAVPGTYGSIIDTLRHTVGADVAYLDVLAGRQPAFDEEAASLADLRLRMVGHLRAWAGVLADDPDPDTPAVRYREDGSEGHAPTGIRLAQVLHHGTDHRSQVCTGLTSMGVEPPEIDVWAFAEAQGRLRDVPPPA